MKPPLLILRFLWCCITLSMLSWCSAAELRGYWVDAFHDGYKSSAQVTQLVADARAGNFNALFVQVRKRGDAYYFGGLEPKATDIIGSTFDPLQDLINKAHNGTPRLAVHAWIVTYNIWNQETILPTQTTHPYRLHPDWLTQKSDGTKWDGNNYAFDPGHPSVQEYTFNVCMDIVNRFDIDGLHFDYIRYTDNGSTIGSQLFGYHPLAVQRFQTLYNRTGIPAPTDSQWLQFRRDQVTSLVRKVYLNAWKQRRAATISAALICYGNAPANQTAGAWQSSEPYARVLQDWRSWLDEGILDLGIPMIYRDYSIAARATQWNEWCAYLRENQADRSGAAGAAFYLNAIAGSISEIKVSRLPSPAGKTLAGVVGYSYAVYTKDTTLPTRTAFNNALIDDATAETYDPGGTPVFGTPTLPPLLPWKTDPSKGHLMGYVRNVGATFDFDGATVTLTGPSTPATFTIKTDATGFFGAVDLPVGNYAAVINIPGYRPVSRLITVNGALVSEWNAELTELPFEITANAWNSNQRQMTLTWNSRPLQTYRVETSTDLATWSPLATNVPATNYITTWNSVAQSPNLTRQYFRVKLE